MSTVPIMISILFQVFTIMGVQAESRGLTADTVHYNHRTIQAPTKNTGIHSLTYVANEKLAQKKLYELLV